MVKLITVSKPAYDQSAFESTSGLGRETYRCITPGNQGKQGEQSRSFKFLAGKGKSAPLPNRMRSGYNALESVFGKDDRARIIDTELAPWRMICALRIFGSGGSGSIPGTGWFVGPKTILTAGHCVYYKYALGGWASKIEVSPGRNGPEFPYGTITSTNFSSLNRWRDEGNQDFDIGCIHLSDPIVQQVGWFAVGAFSSAELMDYLVNISGYPDDLGQGTEQYHHKNRVVRVAERRVFYDVDTGGGQSGAPVWIHETDNSAPIAIGIHTYGVKGAQADLQANSANRIVPEVFEKVQEWVQADGGWPNAS